MNVLIQKPIKTFLIVLTIITTFAWLCFDPSVESGAAFVCSLLWGGYNIIDLLPRKSEYSIPYLHTFESYAHSILIKNIDNIPCYYEFSVFPESPAKATLSDRIKGVVPESSSISLHVSELLTLVGTSKVSSLLTIYPDSVNVQVVSRKKNLSTGFFDEVELLKK